VLRILAGALFLGFAIICWGYGLLSRHLHRPLFLTTAVAIVVMGVLVLVLASTELGARGTAIGLCAGEICLAIGYAIGLRAVDGPLRLLSIESVRALAALAAAFLVGLLVLLESAVAATAVALAVYAIALVALRAIPAEAADLLPAGLRDRAPGWMFAD